MRKEDAIKKGMLEKCDLPTSHGSLWYIKLDNIRFRLYTFNSTLVMLTSFRKQFYRPTQSFQFTYMDLPQPCERFLKFTLPSALSGNDLMAYFIRCGAGKGYFNFLDSVHVDYQMKLSFLYKEEYVKRKYEKSLVPDDFSLRKVCIMKICNIPFYFGVHNDKLFFLTYNDRKASPLVINPNKINFFLDRSLILPSRDKTFQYVMLYVFTSGKLGFDKTTLTKKAFMHGGLEQYALNIDNFEFLGILKQIIERGSII